MAGRGLSPKGTASSAWRSFLKSTAPSGATSTGARVALLVTTIRIAEQQGTHVAASVGLASVVSPSEPPLHLNELGTCARRWRGGNFTAADYRLPAHRRATVGSLSSPSPGGGRLYAPPAAAVREIEAARGRGEADRAVVEHGRPTGDRDAQRQADCAAALRQRAVPTAGAGTGPRCSATTLRRCRPRPNATLPVGATDERGGSSRARRPLKAAGDARDYHQRDVRSEAGAPCAGTFEDRVELVTWLLRPCHLPVGASVARLVGPPWAGGASPFRTAC